MTKEGEGVEMTMERWREATRGALSEYLVDDLVEQIMDDIQIRYEQAEVAGPQVHPIENPHPNCRCSVTHYSGPVYRPAADPDGAYPDESPARHRDVRAQYLPESEVRARMRTGGYVKENLETGLYKLYDQTGTFVGVVSEKTIITMGLRGEITTRHEDEDYSTHWIREAIR